MVQAGGLGVLFSGLLTVGLFVVGAFYAVTTVSTQRGRGQSIDSLLGEEDPRLYFAGLAYEQWLESPLVGTGARTFSYMAVRNWGGSQGWNWLGRPEMVHNDYLQTLAEYGAVGLLVALGVGGLIVFRGIGQAVDRNCGGTTWASAIQLGAIGGICAAMTHAVVDFSLHIVPSMVLFGFFAGVLLRDPEERHGFRSLACVALAVLAISGCLFSEGVPWRFCRPGFVLSKGLWHQMGLH